MLRKLLFKITAGMPCRLINRRGVYPYLERYYLGRLFGVTAYLHRFVARDADEWVHDHPWRWAVAICLTGWYVEERMRWLDPRGWLYVVRTIFPGRPNIILARDFHRIRNTRPETWTLFLHGKRIKSWGFLSRDFGGIAYRQPYDVTKRAHWEASAPVGASAGRQPLGGEGGDQNTKNGAR